MIRHKCVISSSISADISSNSVAHRGDTSVLTLPMASAMDSTMPPTIPPSLAASFSVTMMSSTASFISWAASEMASWVWDAWGHVQPFNISVTHASVRPEGNVRTWQQLQERAWSCGVLSASLKITSRGLISGAFSAFVLLLYNGGIDRTKRGWGQADWFALNCANRQMFLHYRVFTWRHSNAQLWDEKSIGVTRLHFFHARSPSLN